MASLYYECDHCGCEVKGWRFRCTVCPDYDLCNMCHSSARVFRASHTTQHFMNKFWEGDDSAQAGAGPTTYGGHQGGGPATTYVAPTGAPATHGGTAPYPAAYGNQSYFIPDPSQGEYGAQTYGQGAAGGGAAAAPQSDGTAYDQGYAYATPGGVPYHQGQSGGDGYAAQGGRGYDQSRPGDAYGSTGYASGQAGGGGYAPHGSPGYGETGHAYGTQGGDAYDLSPASAAYAPHGGTGYNAQGQAGASGNGTQPAYGHGVSGVGYGTHNGAATTNPVGSNPSGSPSQLYDSGGYDSGGSGIGAWNQVSDHPSSDYATQWYGGGPAQAGPDSGGGCDSVYHASPTVGAQESTASEAGVLSQASSRMWQPVVGDNTAIAVRRTAILTQCQRTGRMWEDPDFVPSHSLLDAKHANRSVVWLRPSEFCPHPASCQLFVDGSDANDIVQGESGNCWVISALAVLATRPDLLKDIIVMTEPSVGAYSLRFYKHGAWIIVTVDDRIPCDARTRKPLYASCKDPNEYWAQILEKALAKLHGSWAALQTGSLGEGFVDLTGGGAQRIDVRTDLALWEHMRTAEEEGWLMGVSASDSSEGVEANIGGSGILANHAYSILGTIELSNGVQLVRCRNPWGDEHEWKGAWSDGSPQWTHQFRCDAGHVDADDGIFFMSLDDFKRYFSTLTICRLYHDSVGKIWHRYLIRGQWEQGKCGGCTNYDTWPNNPQWSIRCEEDHCTAFIMLSQEDRRYLRRRHKPLHSIGFNILRHDKDARGPKTTLRAGDVAGGTQAFVNTRDVVGEVMLAKGHQYVILPTTFQPDQYGHFWIIVYSTNPVQIHRLRSDGSRILKKPASMDEAMRSAQEVASPIAQRRHHGHRQ